MQFLRFNTFTSIATQETRVAIHRGCNSWVAVNMGDDVAVVNGVMLNPSPGPGLSGDVTGVAGNYGELYSENQVQITFMTNVNPRVQFVQKVYALSMLEDG